MGLHVQVLDPGLKITSAMQPLALLAMFAVQFDLFIVIIVIIINFLTTNCRIFLLFEKGYGSGQDILLSLSLRVLARNLLRFLGACPLDAMNFGGLKAVLPLNQPTFAIFLGRSSLLVMRVVNLLVDLVLVV